MKVEDIMVRKIEMVESDAPVFDAIEKLLDKRLRSLVVKPRGERDVYGIITVRDIVYKVIGMNLDPHRVKVEEIAVKPVVCINGAMDLEHAVSLMKNFNVARVFVCDGMDVIGVVSLTDVLSATLIEKARGGRGA